MYPNSISAEEGLDETQVDARALRKAKGSKGGMKESERQQHPKP